MCMHHEQPIGKYLPSPVSLMTPLTDAQDERAHDAPNCLPIETPLSFSGMPSKVVLFDQASRSSDGAPPPIVVNHETSCLVAVRTVALAIRVRTCKCHTSSPLSPD